MKRSKIDRLGNAFRRLVENKMAVLELSMRQAGKTTEANAIKDSITFISSACEYLDRYERLEIDDIIKGHKRAWPE